MIGKSSLQPIDWSALWKKREGSTELLQEMQRLQERYPYFVLPHLVAIKQEQYLSEEENYLLALEQTMSAVPKTDAIFYFLTELNNPHLLTEEALPSPVLEDEKPAAQDSLSQDNTLKARGKQGEASFSEMLRAVIAQTAKVPAQDPTLGLRKVERIESFIAKQKERQPMKHRRQGAPVSIPVEQKEQSILVTETLAELYREQGLFHEALEAYEILVLKNPAKRSYFAPIIEELKTQLE